MSHRVTVAGSQESFICPPNQTVLTAMLHSGRKNIRVGCRGGGCGVCRVQVESGSFVTGSMSAAQVSEADRSAGVALACQLYPRSALQLRPLGRKVLPLGAAGVTTGPHPCSSPNIQSL